jgi:hypothetical protein
MLAECGQWRQAGGPNRATGPAGDCRQNVGSAGPDERGRQATLRDARSRLTCGEGASVGVHNCPPTPADIPRSRGS